LVVGGGGGGGDGRGGGGGGAGGLIIENKIIEKGDYTIFVEDGGQGSDKSGRFIYGRPRK